MEDLCGKCLSEVPGDDGFENGRGELLCVSCYSRLCEARRSKRRSDASQARRPHNIGPFWMPGALSQIGLPPSPRFRPGV